MLTQDHGLRFLLSLTLCGPFLTVFLLSSSVSVSVWISPSFLPISDFAVCGYVCVFTRLGSPPPHPPPIALAQSQLPPFPLAPSSSSHPLAPLILSTSSSITSLSLILPAAPSAASTCTPVPLCTPLLSLSTSSLSPRLPLKRRALIWLPSSALTSTGKGLGWRLGTDDLPWPTLAPAGLLGLGLGRTGWAGGPGVRTSGHPPSS